MAGNSSKPIANPIDCDVHCAPPSTQALLPYLTPHWCEQLTDRGIANLTTVAYPPNAPITAREDFRAGGMTFDALTSQVFDKWGAGRAIINCIYGVQLVHNVDMGVAFTMALNDWIEKEWLDKDERLAASIVLPMQDIDACIDEINRRAPNRQFVQALVLANGEAPLGKRRHWAIFRELEKHNIPLGIHAGSSYHHPVSTLGYPTYYVEDYAAQTFGFQSQLASLITEGAFVKYPGLKVALIELGVTWLPAFMWRLGKFWRGVRREVPWMDKPPGEYIRQHVRMTAQPIDGPEDLDAVEKVIDQIQSDDFLLYASDYPHWHFDGDAIMPPGIPERLHQKMMRDNPLALYTRLTQPAEV